MLLNNDWKVKPGVLLESCCLKILTCKRHNGGYDKLILFAPESTCGHILNTEWSGQLIPCVVKHRVVKQMKASTFNRTFAIYRAHSGFAGTNTMDLATHSSFSLGSELLAQHEYASTIGRNDVNLLLSKKVKQGDVSSEHVDLID